MTQKHAELLEPLAVALKLEMEGRQCFLDAAASTKSKLARQTFEFLAKEEDKHIENIRNFIQSITDTDGARLFDIGVSNADEKLASFNNRLSQLKDAITTTATDVEAYKFALDFENGAEEFYAEQLAKSNNEFVRKFYRWLIDEESMHARLLKSCLKFAEDPAAWFGEHRA
jgi:rubrerythrin